jgi:hypothetical protein
MVQQEQRYSKMTTIDKYASRFDGMMAQHEEIGTKRWLAFKMKNK